MRPHAIERAKLGISHACGDEGGVEAGAVLSLHRMAGVAQFRPAISLEVGRSLRLRKTKTKIRETVVRKSLRKSSLAREKQAQKNKKAAATFVTAAEFGKADRLR